MLTFGLDCSAAALAIPQKVLSIWKWVELKMFDFGDSSKTGISILTWAGVASATTQLHGQNPRLSSENSRCEKAPACFSVLGVAGSSTG